MACRAGGASVEPCGGSGLLHAELLPLTPAGEFLPLIPALDRGGVNAMRVLTTYVYRRKPTTSH